MPWQKGFDILFLSLLWTVLGLTFIRSSFFPTCFPAFFSKLCLKWITSKSLSCSLNAGQACESIRVDLTLHHTTDIFFKSVVDAECVIMRQIFSLPLFHRTRKHNNLQLSTGNLSSTLSPDKSNKPIFHPTQRHHFCFHKWLFWFHETICHRNWWHWVAAIQRYFLSPNHHTQKWLRRGMLFSHRELACLT